MSLTDPGSRGFSVELPDRQLEGFVVRRGDKVYGYANRCPHTGVSLDWVPDVFLDVAGEFIQCSVHGALFAIGTGECLRGPCVGQFLQRLPVGADAIGDIYLELGDLT